MPIAPVWWLDDQEAAAMDETKLNDIIDLTSTYSTEDLKALNKLRKDIAKVIKRK